MRDVGGWTLRLNPQQIDRYTEAGIWDTRTLADHAIDLARKAPEHTVAWDDSPISARHVLTTAYAIAGGLRRTGITPGDVIALQLPNRWECLAINLAACMIGAVVTPLVPIYRRKELLHMLPASGARVLFIPDQFRGIDYRALLATLHGACPNLRRVVVLGECPRAAPFVSFAAFIAGTALSERDRAPGNANAVKLLMYTSGTTGKPKGVLHTHNTLRAELLAVRNYWQIGAADVALMPSPVTHITGYLYGLEMPLMLGCGAVLMPSWDAARAFELVQQHGVTVCIAATPFLAELVAEAERRGEPLASLRLFACGGAPVPPQLVQHAATWLPDALTMRVYGSTEAPTICLGVTPADDPRYAVQTEGRVVGHDVRIIDPQTARPVAAGREGEIATAGPELFVGYADSVDNDGAFLADGAFVTGDLGRMVAREFLQLTGRKKELIIRGGVNIAPKEIEDVLMEHPDIADVAVVGIPHRRLGETVCACIVVRTGARVSLTSIAEFAEHAGLARQKWPQHVETLAALPRTPAGKVRKVALKQDLANRLEPV